MFFRKNKIKETTKKGLYGNRYNSPNISTWDNLSLIEKFCMIFLPVGLGFMIYMMLDMWFVLWWIKLPISIGIVSGFIGVITLLVNFFTDKY